MIGLGFVEGLFLARVVRFWSRMVDNDQRSPSGYVRTKYLVRCNFEGGV